MTAQYLPPLATVEIGSDGFCYQGQRYNHPELAGHLGEEVMLFQGDEKNTLDVCIGSELIAIATVIRLFSH